MPFTLIGHSRSQTAAAFADDFQEINYHDIDTFVEAIDRSLAPHRTREVIPGPHDLCYRVYAEYCVRRGLLPRQAKELAETFHNKRLFRALLKERAGAYSPWFCSSDELGVVGDVPLPVLFKPDHAGGGRGIVLLSDEKDLRGFAASLPAGQATGIFEAVFPGRLFSVTLWLSDGQVSAYYAERELVDNRHFRVNASLTCNAVQTLVAELAIPETLASIYAQAGLRDGFCHTQLLINPAGDWRIVECMLRLPGDLYMYNAEQYGGFPYSDMYVRTFLQPRQGDPSGFTRAVFPDECLYGRAMVRPHESLDGRIEPYCQFVSHSAGGPESYRIFFFRLPQSAIVTPGPHGGGSEAMRSFLRSDLRFVS